MTIIMLFGFWKAYDTVSLETLSITVRDHGTSKKLEIGLLLSLEWLKGCNIDQEGNSRY